MGITWLDADESPKMPARGITWLDDQPVSAQGAQDAAPTTGAASDRWNPTNEMSELELTAAGLGQGLTDAYVAAKQMSAHMMDSPFTGLKLAANGLEAAGWPQLNDALRRNRIAADQEANEKASLDKNLKDTSAGFINGMVGSALPTMAIPAGPAAQGFMAAGAKAAATGALGAALSAPVETRSDFESLVSGEEPQSFLEQKSKQALMGAAFGAGLSSLLKGGGALLDRIRPHNVRAEALGALAADGVKGKAGAVVNPASIMSSPEAQAGIDLALRTGVELTPAQTLNNDSLKVVENAARQSYASRALAKEGDIKRSDQLLAHLNTALDDLTKADASPSAVASGIRDAVTKTKSALEKARSTTAAKDFGEIRALTNGKAAIEPKTTAELLQSIAEENSAVGTPTADSLAAFAKKQLANVGAAGEAPAEGNLDKLMMLRSYLSKVAGGKAKISGENQDRRIAAQLLGTIDDDIEAASDQIGGDLGGMLKKANANYRAHSAQIEGLTNSPLGKLLGEEFTSDAMGAFNSLPAETVVQRMNNLKPTQVSAARQYLEKEAPEVLQQWRRSVVEAAMEKAKQYPGSAGSGNPVIRPDIFVTQIEKNPSFRVLFGKGEAQKLADGIEVARRLGDKTGYNFSGTAAQSEVLGLFNKPIEWAKQGANGVISGVAKAGLSMAGTRGIAEAMTNPKALDALLTLKRLPPGAAKAREAAAYLAAISGSEMMQDPGKKDRDRKNAK